MNHKIPLIDYHFKRILKSCQLLQFNLPQAIDHKDKLINVILEDLNPQKNYRVRVSIYRDGEGLYLPKSNDSLIDLQIQEADNPLNVNKMIKNHVATESTYFNHFHPLSGVKTLSKTSQIQLSLKAQSLQKDDLIITTEEGDISECIASNIFFITEEGFHITPPLSTGCLDGVMRQYNIDTILSQQSHEVEQVILIRDLDQMVAAYTTNAIQGIVPIFKINEIHFDLNPADKWSDLIRSKLMA